MARNRLTMLDVDEVSAVDKAANGKRFLILKSAHAEPTHADPPEAKPTGLAWVRDALRKAVGVAGPNTEVDEMTTEEIHKAVSDALAEGLKPITDRLDSVEKALAEEPAPAEGEPVVKTESDTPVETEPVTMDAIAKMVGDAVSAAVAPLEGRVATIETAAGQRQSGTPAAAGQEVKKSMWAGVL